MDGLQIFGDFGFVGGQDVAPNPLQNAQVCVNFYPEVDQENPKEVVALLGCPGLNPLISAPGGGVPGYTVAQTAWPAPSTLNLPVRGMWELPNGTALFVISNTCYVMSVAVSATSNQFPSFTLTSVGTLLTNSGPVSIRDNNGGGLPYNVSGTTVDLAVIVDGPYGYSYNYNTATFARITDPEFYGADRVVCIDGWFVFNLPGTQIFYTPISPYSLTFSGAGNGTFVALKDAAPDNLVTIAESKQQLWLIGDKTTEIWYDAGGANFAFSRLQGNLLQVGCKAKHSVARFGSGGQDGLIWFGRSDRGENTIVLTEGFSYKVVSDPAFGDEVATYPITNDAIGYSYQEDTHEFYVLTFPTADVTWCYDAQSGLLHKRLSYDPYADKFHRHRSNCYMNFQGMRLVGDYQTGTIHQLTRTAYTDAGWPLVAWRRAPHIWDKGARGRVFMGSLQIEFLPGVGVEQYGGNNNAPSANGVATDNNTILLMHFDGINGSQSFIDDYGRIFTTNNSQPIISTTQVKIGSASAFLGGALQVTKSANTNDFDFGTNDFTIEYWMRGFAGSGMIIGCGAWACGVSGAQAYFGSGSTGGSQIITSITTTPTDGNWHAIAWVKKSGIFNCFVDGVITSTTADVTNYSAAAAPFNIGGISSAPGSGYVDELRVSKIARYTASYIPSTLPFVSYIAPNFGYDPQAKLSISRDGGQTFGQTWPAPIGRIGNTRNRTMWRRLGFARDSVVDLKVIDPVRRDIVGATLRAFSS
jgi:hypothetical protein